MYFKSNNLKEWIIIFPTRFSLAIALLPYALTKIFRTQFTIYPFSYWEVPLSEIPGSLIAWRFLSYNSWFEILLGCFELGGAILLMYRKTYLLGALFLFPIILNIVLVNFGLDLWNQTIKISLLLLFGNLILLAFNWRIILTVFKKLIPEKINSKKEAIIMSLILIVGIGYFGEKYYNYSLEQNNLVGDWLENNPNRWDSLESNDQIYFMPQGGIELKIKDEKLTGIYYYSTEDSVFIMRGTEQLFNGRYKDDKMELTFINFEPIGKILSFESKPILD